MTASLLFLGAAVFYAIAGLGLIRLPDPLARLHAGAKASSLATILALSAAFAHHGTMWTGLLCLGGLFFVFLTAPLASHAIARTVLRSRLKEGDPIASPNPEATSDRPPDRAPPSARGDRPRNRLSVRV